MRALGAAGILLAVFFVALTVGPATDRKAYAGGGINYKVTVQNPTQYEVLVWVTVRTASLGEKADASTTRLIQPGGSATIETGALCPAGIDGNIYYKPGKYLTMRQMDCLGGDHNPESTLLTTCCWNISVRVCERPPHFTFCKQ